MSDPLDLVYRSIDEQHSHESAHTRRNIIKGATAALGGMGILSVAPQIAMAGGGGGAGNTPENITAVAATAEVLATIVNTVGGRRIDFAEDITKRNVAAAAREELIHYNVLTSSAVGGKAITKRIWVPDAVFASEENFLRTLVVGDQIFINAYLIGTTVFGNAGNGTFARFAAEFMGAEAVHRAVALQSLGRLGNDRAFMRYEFTSINTAVELLQKAGFGFGKKGKGPGRFYDFDTVKRDTPNPSAVNTRSPR